MTKKRGVAKHVVVGGRKHVYTLRRSRRAKHVLVHVDELGRIEVVVPWGVAYREAERFVVKQEAWLARQVVKQARRRAAVPRLELRDGVALPLLGERRRLEVDRDGARRRPRFADGAGFVRVYVGKQEQVRPTLVRWYKREARDYFVVITQQLARRAHRRVGRLVISDARSQWGSCNAETGRISLHWRLLLGPREVADYVAAHEVAHLVHSNHSRAFWRQVGRLMPEYERARGWLRKRGHTLVL